MENEMPAEQTGRYFTFFFWNVRQLLERRVTIYTHRDREEWAKTAAWEHLASQRGQSLETVKASWRLTSTLIQHDLNEQPVSIA